MKKNNDPVKVWMYKKLDSESEKDATIKILRDFNAKRLLKENEKILINPNWVQNEHFDQGNCTSTNTIEGIVIYLLEECNVAPSNIIIGDGAWSDAAGCIKTCGVDTLGDKYGIQVMNFDIGTHGEKVIDNPLSLSSVSISSIFDEVDVIISVPSLKTHIWSVTTLSLKNLVGFMEHKTVIHSSIHQRIADLATIFRDKMRFSIIDGYIGSDGMECAGCSIKMDLVLVAEDPVALDTVGSKVMGYDKKICKYLQYCDDQGLGTSNLSDIEIIGPKIRDVSKKFIR